MTAADRLRALAAKRTPGNWKVGPHEGWNTSWVAITNINREPERGDTAVWTTPATEPTDDREAADAALIALAPDLAAWAADAADELRLVPTYLDIEGKAAALLARLDRITEAHPAPETPGEPQ